MGHLYGLQLRIHETLPVDATAQKELDRFTENQKLFQYLQLLPTDAAATDTAPKLVELADAMGAARAKTNDTVLRNVLKDAAGKTTQCA